MRLDLSVHPAEAVVMRRRMEPPDTSTSVVMSKVPAPGAKVTSLSTNTAVVPSWLALMRLL